MERLGIDGEIAAGVDLLRAVHRRGMQVEVGAGVQGAAITHRAIRVQRQLAIGVERTRIAEVARGVQAGVAPRIGFAAVRDGTDIGVQVARSELPCCTMAPGVRTLNVPPTTVLPANVTSAALARDASPCRAQFAMAGNGASAVTDVSRRHRQGCHR